MGINFEPPFSVKQTEGLTWSKEGFGLWDGTTFQC